MPDSSLKKPSRYELWVELLNGEITIEDAELLLGKSAIWHVDGIRIGKYDGERVLEDGPSWAPSRHIRVVFVADRAAFDEWVNRWLDEDFIEEYRAASVVKTLEAQMNPEEDVTISSLFKNIKASKP